MVCEFNNEEEAVAFAKATASSYLTKKEDTYIVSDSKDEICNAYNMGFWKPDKIFYDKDLFEEACGHLEYKDKNIVDASTVLLPYNIKTCNRMFQGCNRLKYPPKIPTSVESCFEMFVFCRRLKEKPDINDGVRVTDAFIGTKFSTLGELFDYIYHNYNIETVSSIILLLSLIFSILVCNILDPLSWLKNLLG